MSVCNPSLIFEFSSISTPLTSPSSLLTATKEEYSTMLLWLQNQVEGGTPNPTYVDRCLDWLEKFPARLSPPTHGNAA